MSNGMFKQKVVEQNANLTYYANIVEIVKEGHIVKDTSFNFNFVKTQFCFGQIQFQF